MHGDGDILKPKKLDRLTFGSPKKDDRELWWWWWCFDE